MKESARLIAAALLGVGIGIAATAASEPSLPHPVNSEEAAVIAQHFDSRLDRIERLLRVVGAQVDSDLDDAKNHITAAVQNNCGNR